MHHVKLHKLIELPQRFDQDSPLRLEHSQAKSLNCGLAYRTMRVTTPELVAW